MNKYKEYISKSVTILSVTIISAFALIVLYVGLRVFLYDTYPVNSLSMLPTIQPGDRILVNKLIFGARIYKNLNAQSSDSLQTWRVKGIRPIKHNDVVVFNYPSDDWYPTRFVVNSVFVKRCVGLPGDTLSIMGGIYGNTSTSDTLGLPSMQGRNVGFISAEVLNSYPFDDSLKWTILDFGPLYIPQAGDVIDMTELHFKKYHKYIVYETSENLDYDKDNEVALLGGVPLLQYTFRDNYYFMAGDNFSDSRDSRYFGLIPEKFIIGVAPRVLFSREKGTSVINFKRIYKKI